MPARHSRRRSVSFLPMRQRLPKISQAGPLVYDRCREAASLRELKYSAGVDVVTLFATVRDVQGLIVKNLQVSDFLRRHRSHDRSPYACASSNPQLSCRFSCGDWRLSELRLKTMVGGDGIEPSTSCL